MKSVVVVGGGVAGLLAGLLAVRKGHRVSVVESAEECGGLLGSFQGTDGHWYDYGTHLLRDTGVDALDGVLFGELDDGSWQRLTHLQTGGYFGGRFNEENRFPDTNALPKATYERGLADLLRCAPGERSHETARGYVVDRFGPTFAEHVFEPAAKKLYGVPLENLTAEALGLFGLNRLIVATPEVSRELKRVAHFDSRIAFHSSGEGISGRTNYYPARGGIGQWVRGLQQRLQGEGAAVYTGAQVASLDHDGGHVRAVMLANGRRLVADEVIWTVSAAVLARYTKQDVPSFRPVLRKTCLYYFVVDEPFRSGSHFFLCYDPALQTFRTTLYSNLRSDPAERSHYACCVEVLIGADEDVPSEADMLNEQIKMGVVERSAQGTLVGQHVLRHGFPVLTPDFIEMTRQLRDWLHHAYDNVLLLGRASGGTFLMNDTLIQTHQLVEPRL